MGYVNEKVQITTGWGNMAQDSTKDGKTGYGVMEMDMIGINEIKWDVTRNDKLYRI